MTDRIELLELELVGDEWPLLPDGEYTVQYIKHEIGVFKDVPRVYVHFEILDPGPFQGIRLYKPYPLRKLAPGDSGAGKFKLGKGQNLYVDLCNISGQKIRGDRFSPIMIGRVFSGKQIVATTKTVTKTAQGDRRAKCIQYSRIDKLLCVKDQEEDLCILSEDQRPPTFQPSPPTGDLPPSTLHHTPPERSGNPLISAVSKGRLANLERKKCPEEQTTDEWLSNYFEHKAR